MNAPASAPEALATAAFDYELPEERIAQRPLAQRDASRLLVVGADGAIEDRVFTDLPALLRPGDVCVVNDTRVRAARLRTRREDGSAAELLVLRREADPAVYACLVRPARRLPEGSRLRVGSELEAVVLGRVPGHDGARAVRFHVREGDIEAAIERLGQAPLPPYIHEKLDDASRYQTVYADGSVESAAAPTAGLHFTPAVIDAIRARGIAWVTVRLEVGLGTFAPIRSEELAAHVMHHERYSLSDDAVQTITAARERGGRVIAVGTSVVRVLESCAANGQLQPGSGSTQLFVTPGHRFNVVDALVTNFHQPRSTPLVLVAAFIGMQQWPTVYDHALTHGYRFLSFGDAMLALEPHA